ncbi:MAG: hydrogenase maturation protease [Candidatus Krumholzibacteria bacterium]|nr:hydrogenase maturation protease [Candidatus Krumholzibacteria bacterium]
MAESTESRCATRLLCLGNDILADDAFGFLAARELQPLLGDKSEVVLSTESGLRLLDHLLGKSRVVVIDTVQTGAAPPGTIHTFTENDFPPTSSGSPHYVGLFEALAVGRMLGLPVAHDVIIVAVEACDCVTVGGDMHPAVQATLPRVVRIVEGLIR